MIAEATNNLRVLNHHLIDGETVIEVNCRDYVHYASLPEVVKVNGQLLALTGWSSDKMIACYKSGCLLAFPSTNKGA